MSKPIYTIEEISLFDIALTYGNTADIRHLIAKFGKAKCDAMFEKLTGQKPC